MPLAWLALGYALGLFAGQSAGAPALALGLMGAALGAAYLRLRSAGLRTGLAALLLAGALLGMVRSGPAAPQTNGGTAASHGASAVVRAAVIGVPEIDGGALRMRAAITERRTPNGWTDASGNVIVWAGARVPPVDGREHPYLRHGDAVTIDGVIDAPSDIGPFDYREHLAARGVGAVISPARIVDVTPGDGGAAGAVHALRSRLAGSLERHAPEPAASLAAAMLLGLRAGVPDGVSENFRGAGLAHLLAISGMHVGIVMGIALLASRALFGRRYGLYLAAPALLTWGYVLLAGAPPSAVRAGLMASAFLLALAAGRMPAALNALGLAALVLLLVEPSSLWDRSFQLSFAAMAGVLLIGLPAQARARERAARASGRLPRPLAWAVGSAAAGLAVSLGAFLGALPLVVFNFGEAPLLGAPATVAALAIMPLFLAAAALTALAGLLFGPLASAAGAAAGLVGYALSQLASAVAAVPWSRTDAALSAAGVWTAYAAMGCALAAAHRRGWTPAALDLARAAWRGPERRVEAVLAVGVLLVIAAVPWTAAAAAPSRLVHLHVLDVGQGEAALLTTPSGGAVLIDGGPDPGAAIAQIDAVLPLSRLDIDLAVLTHPHADHLNGLLELARRGRLGAVAAPPPVPGEDASWRAELDALGLRVVEAERGMTAVLPGGTRLELLNPPRPLLSGTRSDVDNNSVVVRIVHGRAAALLMADVFADGELALLDAGLDLSADVLKLGHHGSDTSTSPELLAAAEPWAAVVSVGADNRFGHPSRRVVERAERWVGGQLFSTADHGRVRFSTDGARWWASSERD